MRFRNRRVAVIEPQIEESVDIVFDRALGQSRVEAFSHAVMSTDYGAARSIFEASDNWNERQHMVEVVSHVEGRPEQIVEWPDREPGLPLPLLVRGAQVSTWAWAERSRRTEGRPEDSRDFSDGFIRDLNFARSDLRKVGLMVPADAISRLALLKSAKALGAPLGDLREQYYRVQELAPQLYSTYAEFLQCCTAKWAGSSETMFQFARHISSVSPDGSPLHALVPIAHLEHYMLQPNLAPHDYFTGDVKDEIHQVAQRSVLSRTFFATADFRPKIAVLNMFALAAFFCDEQKLTHQLMRILDDNLLSEYPWTNFDEDPVDRYQRVREMSRNMYLEGRTGDWI